MTSPEKRISRVMRSMEKRIAVLEATEFGGGFDGESVVRPVVSASETLSIGDSASLSVNQLKSLTMKTTGFSDVDDSSAKLFGELDRLTSSTADCDFQYGKKSGSVTDNNTADQQFSSATSYDEDITGLDADTTYEFRARGVASDGDTDRGSVLTFTTGSGSSDYVVEIYDDSARTNLVESFTLTPQNANSLNYITALASDQDTGGGSPDDSATYELRDMVVDGTTQDFTTFTVDDPQNAINSITASTIDVDEHFETDELYVYKSATEPTRPYEITFTLELIEENSFYNNTQIGVHENAEGGGHYFAGAFGSDNTSDNFFILKGQTMGADGTDSGARDGYSPDTYYYTLKIP